MNKLFFKKIISVSFIALLIPTLLAVTNSQLNNQITTQFTTEGNDIFVEDFTTLNYKGLTTASGWGTGAISNKRNLSTSFLDSFATSYPISDIEVQGRKVYGVQYFGSSTQSLNVFDINDPSDISRTGARNSMPYQYSIAVEGDIVYAGQSSIIASASLASYNYSDPYSNGDYLMSTYCDGHITDIETNGYLVYYTVYKSISGYSFRVMNAEDPYSHIPIVPTWLEANALGIAVDGNLAYVAASDVGFYVINVTDQNNFVEWGFTPTFGNASDVVVDGTLAYLANGDAGVSIIDIAEPTNPTVLGSIDTPGFARKLVKQGNTLFVADREGGLVILDVADRANPALVPHSILLPIVWDVDIYGEVLVLATDYGLTTLKLGYGITNIANNAFQNPYSNFNVSDVRVRGHVAVVAGGFNGLFTLDVSDPDNPILLDQDVLIALNPPNYRKLEIQGNYAFVADYGNAIRIYDISDPSNIYQTTSVGLTYATDVAVYGDIVIVADGAFGVYMYNISNPNAPAFHSSFDIFNNITSCWIQGPTLYLVDSKGGGYTDSLYIYDLKDSINEVQVSATSRYDEHYDIKVDGDVAYLSSQVWCSTYNVSNPASPVFGWDLEYLGGQLDSHGVWNFGPHVLSASMTQGVHIIDATIIAFSPGTNAQNYPNATGAIQITTHGDYTYIANTTSLVILRHSESYADTYVSGSTFAQSTDIDSIDGVIKTATLQPIEFVPPGTGIDYFMSADGGLHWEPVLPGVEHEFINFGDDLRWQAVFTGPSYRSAHLYQITIDYAYNEEPSIPTIAELGEKTFGSFKVDWDDSTDDVAVDHYTLQMSDTLSFIDIQKEWTTTKSQQSVTLAKGTYYFRVQAVDDEGLPSPWSLIKVANVKTSGALLYVIIVGGALVLIAAIVIPLVLIMRRKKKGKLPTR